MASHMGCWASNDRKTNIWKLLCNFCYAGFFAGWERLFVMALIFTLIMGRGWEKVNFQLWFDDGEGIEKLNLIFDLPGSFHWGDFYLHQVFGRNFVTFSSSNYQETSNKINTECYTQITMHDGTISVYLLLKCCLF